MRKRVREKVESDRTQGCPAAGASARLQCRVRHSEARRPHLQRSNRAVSDLGSRTTKVRIARHRHTAHGVEPSFSDLPHDIRFSIAPFLIDKQRVSHDPALVRGCTMRRRMFSIAAQLALVVAAVAACGGDGESTRSLMALPVRWCVMEGSSETSNMAPGSLAPTYRLDNDALLRANEIWAQAGIFFFSVAIDRNGTKGIPVINDPDTFQALGEQVGDIDATAGDPFESQQASFECQRTWAQLAPDLKGPIVVTAKKFVNAGLTLAGASQPAFALWVAGRSPLTGARGDDLCGSPRRLVDSDVFEIDGNSNHTDVGWLVISQPDEFASVDQRARALAHELGHILLLSHGNGLDDDGNGNEVGTIGPRRFDDYCDPVGSSNEDLPSPEEDCKSLMDGRVGCGRTLKPLQIEQARAAAALMPGCMGVDCRK